MNGRDIFRKYNKIISFLKICSKYTPKFVLNFMWSILSNSESKVALLLRYLYICKYSFKCGENIYVGNNVTIKNIKKLSLGNNISIHSGSYIDAAGEIIINDNVSIANQSSIISFEHSWNDIDVPIKYNKVIFDEIYIDEDVWIGAGCRILSGVKINSRSIVAAGAVVTKNVKSNTIVGGIPAKCIKNI